MDLDALNRQMIAWRRDLHAHPEFGAEEKRTGAFVAATLRSFGIEEVVEGVGGTGVVGTIRRGTGNRAIALRADMDALRLTETAGRAHGSTVPGTMHACGHDGHTAMLLGAARLLAEQGRFDGTVRLVFQPAEEWGKGALAMLDDGLLERFPFEEIYGLHNMPGLPVGHFQTRPGPLMSAEDNFEIVLKGLGGHATRPHLTSEVLVAACATVMNLQTIVSRRLDPTDIAVVSVTGLLTDGIRNALPGTARILGDARSFTRHWRKPIEEGGDGRRARWLAARVRPFLLRRLKDEVAPELPPLTELQVRLTLPMPQRQLYESVRVAADHMVRRILARQGLEGGLISVLDAMLRLRQLCCDPRLIEEIPPNLGEGVKLAWLREHLPDLLRQGRRVLVFSQFARMLDLVDGLLRELGLPALRLSGETPESQRGARVARFQAGECPLMLLSLKAGGVGLNLTAADTVIHLDPWWNPAVQAQASARAHRIGQDKPVFVHHLLVQGSIEERILALQARKKALAEGVMGVDGAAELLKFSAADLDGLLAPLPEAMDGMDGTGGGPDDAEFPS